MKKYLIMLLIGLLHFTNCLIAQDLKGLEQMKEMNNNIQRSKQIKDYFLDKSFVDYLHNGFFYDSRAKMLEELKISDFGKDSLIFVEIYSREAPSSNYTCSFYKSGCAIYTSIYIERAENLKIEYLDSGKSFTQYIIDEIKKGNIDEIIKKGDKANIYPVHYIIITLVIKQNKDYKIQTYTTEYFP